MLFNRFAVRILHKYNRGDIVALKCVPVPLSANSITPTPTTPTWLTRDARARQVAGRLEARREAHHRAGGRRRTLHRSLCLAETLSGSRSGHSRHTRTLKCAYRLDTRGWKVRALTGNELPGHSLTWVFRNAR